MLVRSQAGEFEVNVMGFELENDDLVMVGAMGVWEARTHIGPQESLAILCKVLCSSAVWRYLLFLPLRLIRRSRSKRKSPARGFENEE